MESEPPYQYVWSNPINYIDPAGLQPPPCTGNPTQICITQPAGSGTNEYPPQPPPPTPIAPWTPPPLPPPPPPSMGSGSGPGTRAPSRNEILADALGYCFTPPTPFSAPGYVEGNARSKSGIFITEVYGDEVVYDFATMERGAFKFTGIPLDKPGSPIGYSTAVEDSSMAYHLDLAGFDSNDTVRGEYSGPGTSLSFGVSAPFGKYGSAGIGMVKLHSASVEGTGTYGAGSAGWSPIPFAASLANADYSVKYEPVRYGYKGYVDHQDIEQIQADIMSGVDSPWPTPSGIGWFWRHNAATTVEDVWEKHEYYFTMRLGEPH